MWKSVCVLLCLALHCSAGPLAFQRKNMPIVARQDATPAEQQEQEMTAETAEEPSAETAPMVGTLTLPSNATSIRADITDNFSCANKSYGYYADVENDCQIFHVCLPVTYADGKEQTFRWSFICPEETIFSQESFTCMRREDMTIECEDSFRYYELNGNFGLTTEEQEESIKQPTVDKELTQPAVEQPAQKPLESEVAAASAPEQLAKPVKVQKPKPKPNRRKPAVSYNKPQTQRKTPTTAAAPLANEVVEEPKPVVTEATLEPKPAKPARFPSRPSTAPKEKPQVVKVAVTPTRNELFNSNRKRPAVFNKISSASTTKPAEETEAVTEAVVQVELKEPKPTLKLETMFNQLTIKPEPEPAAAIVPVEDAIAQASEAAAVIAEPEQPEEPAMAQEAAPTKIEIATNMEQVAPIEADEEIPAVIVETFEEKPKDSEPAEAEQKPTDAETAITDKTEQTKATVEPAIVDPNSSGELALEAMEEAKPADAPESMPATPEMELHSPLVEEVLDNSSSAGASNEAQKESIGGFKPVDPAMAAEAEQLITDFLNTLKKNELIKSKTEQAAAVMDMAETIEPQQSVVKQENETQNADEAVSIEEAKLPEPEITEKEASVEEQLLEAEEPQQLKQDSPITNIVMMNQLPSEMYQIPVQVIAAPDEVPQSISKPEDKPAEINVAETDAAVDAFMPPISIDDIVELVKERLDQTPKNEQLGPMELVLTPGAAAPVTLIQSNKVQESNAEADTQRPIEQPQEEQIKPEQEQIIVPIYKRVTAAEPAMTKVQTVPVTASKLDTNEETSATHAQQAEITPIKMDARKRRFLFRADAS